jgi:hypothetical protein
MTHEKAEAIARAPWAYASADITAALQWALEGRAPDHTAILIKARKLVQVTLDEGVTDTQDWYDLLDMIDEATPQTAEGASA